MTQDELMHYKFTPAPYALEAIQNLKQKGHLIAICSNSNAPQRNLKILDQCEFKRELFDEIITSGNVEVRKPNPKILEIFKNKFQDIPHYNMIMIGDMIDRDI